MESLNEKIEDLLTRLNRVANEETLQKDNQRIRELEAISMKADFWQDTTVAQETMRELSALTAQQKEIEDLKSNLITAKELLTVSGGQGSNGMEAELAKLEERIASLETLSFLSGPYDRGDAIISIHAGQGGVEAMDWAAMLLRMYLKYASKKNWGAELFDESKGEEAGIKSASIEIRGTDAYGLLKKEAGTHRLVRQSPFNADNLRQTSFALVEILPSVAEAAKKEINPDEIEMETFRASGPGGQNVQKVNSAVRLRHKPSGIVVTAQSERSQLQNRESALKVLAAKLYLLEEAKRVENERSLKGEYKTASWGNQIRSYVLHPYKQVKDLRTDLVSNDPDAVLAGYLDPFIEAELKI